MTWDPFGRKRKAREAAEALLEEKIAALDWSAWDNATEVALYCATHTIYGLISEEQVKVGRPVASVRVTGVDVSLSFEVLPQ